MSLYLKDKHPRIGDVYMMDFYGQGSAQSGMRPGIVIQNNIGNKNSPNVVAIPLTSALKNLHQPTHVVLPAAETGLKVDSMVICESPMSIPKENIHYYMTTIPNHYMRKVAKAFLIEHPMLYYLNMDDVSSVQKEAYSLFAV
jgi:mRNA interferase MazF